MLFAPAGFAVHLPPDLSSAYHDEVNYRDAKGAWDTTAVGVDNVYSGPLLSGDAAHTPWFLLEIAGRFRPINAAFTRPCFDEECDVEGCTLKASCTRPPAERLEPNTSHSTVELPHEKRVVVRDGKDIPAEEQLVEPAPVRRGRKPAK